MTHQNLAQVADVARDAGYFLVATADTRSVPHIAAGRTLCLDADGRLVLGGWFCPGTLGNVHCTRNVAVVVWDPPKDAGFQLVGKVEEMLEVGALDGCSAGEASKEPIPQVQRELYVRVSQVMRFSHAPHSDLSESPVPESVPSEAVK